MKNYKGKNYRGSDLPQKFKSFANKEKRRLKGIFESRGCTDFVMSYGFWYFSGFFTAPSGQVYYFMTPDLRGGYNRLMIRTASDYSDYSGGINRYSGVSNEALLKFKL